jgi:hypothetical protein
MAEHDTTANHGGADSPEPTTIGNRPATGARLVDHTTSLPTSFGGGQEATDFLGLSQDLVAPDAGSASSSLGTGAGLMPSTAASSTFSAEPEGSASWLLSGRQQTDSAEEVESADASDAEELESVGAGERPSSSGSKRILSVAVAVLLIGAAVTVAMRFSRQETPLPATAGLPKPPPKHAPAPDSTELAANPDRPATGRQTILPDGTTVPVATSTEPLAPTTVETTAPAPPEPVTATPTAVQPSAAPARIAEQRLSRWMSRHGWSAPAADGAGTLFGAPTTPAGWPKSEAFAFASNARNATPSAEWVSTADQPSTAVETVPLVLTEGGARDPKNPLSPFEPNGGSAGPKTKGPGELRFATQEDLANIWGAETIPMDEIDGPERIVTPAVGMVRVVLTSGQIFDGRLYAVGQGQVWLETDFGRLALAGKRVRAIDVVILEKQAKVVESLPRMRVRTPGGLFFGKVLARDDVHVTLLLDSGGRITLESNDVEPAPLGDIRVVGPVKP